MVVVVPREELAAEIQGVFETAEAVGEFRPVLQRLELALGERVVVRDGRRLWDLLNPRVARS